MRLTQEYVWLLGWVFVFSPLLVFLFLGTPLQRELVVTSHVHLSTICSDLPPVPKGPSNFTSHKFTSGGLAKTVKCERFPWQTPRLFTEMGRRIHQALALLLQAPSASTGAS